MVLARLYFLSYAEIYQGPMRSGVGAVGKTVRSSASQAAAEKSSNRRRAYIAGGHSGRISVLWALATAGVRLLPMSVSLKSLGIDRLGVEGRIALVV
jgi:hypothetical protein